MFRKITAILLLIVFALSSGTVIAAENDYNMVINENNTVRNITREMYGVNCEWSVGINANYFDVVGGEVVQAPSFAEAWKDTMVFARMAGASSQLFKWKDALGDFEDRKVQKIWSVSDVVYLGIVEWVKAIQSVTPDIKIAYVVNLNTDTLENLADVVEFLIGDGTVNYNGGENWAEKRKQLGIEDPVSVFTWELGNEMDLEGWDADTYVQYCKKVIPIIKSIDPDANITAHADTAAHANGKDRTNTCGWENWHRKVLTEIGDQIDNIAFHYYYPAGYVARANDPLDRLEKDIVEITGSDRIKIYISEQAPAPNSQTYNPESPYDYCLPHTIWGATALAEFYFRAMLRDSVIASTCHSIDSATWTLCYRNEAGGHSLSATGETIKSFAKYGVGDMLECKLDTFSKEELGNIAGAAVKDKDGNINILFTNRSDTDAANVNFEFQNGEYKLKMVRKIHGDVRSADNWYRAGDQWTYNNPDRVEITETNEDSVLTSYSFDPLSVYVLCLEKTGE